MTRTDVGNGQVIGIEAELVVDFAFTVVAEDRRTNNLSRVLVEVFEYRGRNRAANSASDGFASIAHKVPDLENFRFLRLGKTFDLEVPVVRELQPQSTNNRGLRGSRTGPPTEHGLRFRPPRYRS